MACYGDNILAVREVSLYSPGTEAIMNHRGDSEVPDRDNSASRRSIHGYSLQLWFAYSLCGALILRNHTSCLAHSPSVQGVNVLARDRYHDPLLQCGPKSWPHNCLPCTLRLQYSASCRSQRTEHTWRRMGEWRYTYTDFSLVTKWTWVTSFMPQPL
jgi:hypothetical protein